MNGQDRHFGYCRRHLYLLKNNHQTALSFLHGDDLLIEKSKNSNALFYDLGSLDVKAIIASKNAIWNQVLKERNSNIAVDFYYVAKEYYEKKMTDSACYYINIAAKFDSLDNDIQRVFRNVCSTSGSTASANNRTNDTIPGKVISPQKEKQSNMIKIADDRRNHRTQLVYTDKTSTVFNALRFS